jgi:hypothetical protein
MADVTYLIKINSPAEATVGSVIRRYAADGSKIQQGHVEGLTDTKDAVIVSNVVDLKQNSFVTEAGIIRPAPDDQFYLHTSQFGVDPLSDKALEVISEWPLFKEHADLQAQIIAFAKISYSPAHIIEMKKNEQLAGLFVPIQEKFGIGRFKTKIDFNKELIKRFHTQLDSLYEDAHLTYVAFVPREKNKTSKFFSIGTKPHLETQKACMEDPGGFKPNQGGHLKIISRENELPKKFMVDAGSYELGGGQFTSLAIAEMVTDAMKENFPDFEFVPIAGRGAYGLAQSH